MDRLGMLEIINLRKKYEKNRNALMLENTKHENNTKKKRKEIGK